MSGTDISKIKQRFGIIGNSEELNRAIYIAVQVAPTDLSVLITGESGTGKESFPQIIHQNSARKHGSYIAVNCGAIPEGTIDSELFGHEKGSFTGAVEARKGYFEVADGGTIFLDEVADLPLSTQVRLLRVLETGEFMKVGSSKLQKTDVRVVAATNINVIDHIQKGRFREDLFYRLNTVPIHIPPLRDRGDDIYLLFRKFASDFADRYRMPSIQLDEAAKSVLKDYFWPGNVRQLKNITEQISIIEETRDINEQKLIQYLPNYSTSKLPALVSKDEEVSFASEREILYKVLFDMKKDVTELRKLVTDLMKKEITYSEITQKHGEAIQRISSDKDNIYVPAYNTSIDHSNITDTQEILEESLSLNDRELELIRRALEKYDGKRKEAANDLGISERTLYRKIKEHNL